MVARQGKEQSHWGGGRLGGSFRTSRSKHEEIPSYNLPPPRFAQKALNMALDNWECVKSVLLCGCEGVESVEGHVDTTSLDCFTHLLLTRLSQKVHVFTCVLHCIGLQRAALYGVAMCCTVQGCSVLHCTGLQCTALYGVAVCCTVQGCSVLHCTGLQCTALYRVAMYCTVWGCSVLHCIGLQCAALYRVAMCCITRIFCW